MDSAPTRFLSVDGYLKHGRPVHLDIELANPFDFDGLWLRGNTHCDAAQGCGPERSLEACDWYREHGFDFLVISHSAEEMGPASTEGDFAPIRGEEVHPNHLIAIGATRADLPDFRKPEYGDATEQTVRCIEWLRSRGAVPLIAHPSWTVWSWEALVSLIGAGAAGLEVTNSDWRHEGLARADQIYAMLVGQGHRLAAVGGDDAHDVGDELSGKCWTGVLAAERTPEAICEAIRQRRTYASEGPVIRGLRIEEPGRVVVECSSCRACFFCTRGWCVENQVPPAPAERFELDLATHGYRISGFFTITLEDESGNRAWTSPIDATVTRS